jgi:repressor LexA
MRSTAASGLPDHVFESLVDAAIAQIGPLVKSTRIAKDYSATEAAERCHMSRKHFTEIENGTATNPTLRYLLKIAIGLNLRRMRLGSPLTIDAFASGPSPTEIDIALRQVANAFFLLTGKALPLPENDLIPDGMPDDKRPLAPVLSFQPVRFGEGVKISGDALPPELASHFEIVRDIPNTLIRVEVSGEVTLDEPIHPVSEDYVEVPEFVLDRGEVLLRVRGDSLRDWGIQHGDLLVIERRSHASNGETVLALHNGKVVIGRFWTKHGEPRILLSDDASVYVSKTEGDQLEIYGAINSVVSKR